MNELFLCVQLFCLFVYMCTVCLLGLHGDKMRVLGLPELELQAVVSCPGRAGNPTRQVLWNKNQCSSTLSPSLAPIYQKVDFNPE